MHDYHLLNGLLLAGALLFVLGATGFVTRRSLPVMLLSVGIMLQGVMLTVVAFSFFHGLWTGHVFALFVLAVAVVEGLCGWGLLLQFVQRHGTTDIDDAPAEEATAVRESGRRREVREEAGSAALDRQGDSDAGTAALPGETP